MFMIIRTQRTKATQVCQVTISDSKILFSENGQMYNHPKGKRTASLMALFIMPKLDYPVSNALGKT